MHLDWNSAATKGYTIKFPSPPISLLHALLLSVFWVSFSVNCLFISLSHRFTKLLVYFLLVCGRFFSQGKVSLMLTDLLSAALGKHTNYFPAELFYCHAENKAQGSNHSAWTTVSEEHQVFPSAFREAFPEIPRRCTCRVVIQSYSSTPQQLFLWWGKWTFYCPTQKPCVTCGNWVPRRVACVTELLIFKKNLNYFQFKFR